VLIELNGKTFAEISNRDQRRLLNRTIRCVVITEDSHPDIKFDVFERLNTGAVRLTDQELRNSIYRGPLNDALKEAARFEPSSGFWAGSWRLGWVMSSSSSDSSLLLTAWEAIGLHSGSS
jgi:hypothetical protein